MPNEWLDYYKILGITRNATKEEIKKAHISKVQQYHPDKHIGASEEEIQQLSEKFRIVTEAYKVLKDEETRQKYNSYYDYYQTQKATKKRAKAAHTSSNSDTETRKKKTRKTKKEFEEEYWKEYNSIIQEFTKSFKTAYQEERKKEKKYSFLQRRVRCANYLDENFPEFSGIARVGMHTIYEAAYTISKLSVKKKDTFYHYTVRNRRTIAAVVVGGILISSGLFQNSIPTDASPKEEPLTSESTTEYAYASPKIELTRIYEIKAADTLSELAEDANCNMSDIKSRNDIKSDMIRMGDTIEIPYYIPKDELYLYIESKPYDNTINLFEYAQQYNTTAESLLKINEEAIVQTENNYCVISDSLMVPTFKPYQPIKSQEKVKK